MNVAERFTENLIRYRKKADLSQEELGLAAGLHRTEIGQLERGDRLPRIDTLVKLAGGLGIGPCDLLEGIKWQPGETRAGQFNAAERREHGPRETPEPPVSLGQGSP